VTAWILNLGKKHLSVGVMSQCGGDPRRCSTVCGDEYWARDLGDGTEGRRPACSVCQGWQDW